MALVGCLARTLTSEACSITWEMHVDISRTDASWIRVIYVHIRRS